MKKTAFFCLISLIYLTSNSIAQTPTKWRGPSGNGIYPDKGLLKEWPTNGPEILWHFEGLDKGHSSPVFANNQIYMSTMIDSTGYIFVFDLAGKLLWKAEYGKEFIDSYEGSRSSPVVVDELMYMHTGYGKVVCMDADNGELKWIKDLFNDFDGKNIRWGITETMTVDGEKIYCTPGGKKNNVVALNRMNGDLIWSCEGKGEKSAYCSPTLFEKSGKKILVTMTTGNILGIDANNGQLLWSYEQTNKWSVHANTPLYHEGGLFCFSGYGQGGVKLVLNEDGTAVTKQWFSQPMDSRMGGAVLVDGYIYGSGDASRTWQCLDWNTGEQKYSSKAIAKGVTIYADGMLYCYSERGELALVKADPSGFNIISKTKVTLGSEQHWAHPVINNGILYVRHGDALIAYKIK
jgi:outer membrane protein assembly factor BamB